MKRNVLLFALLSLPACACGPWFPDTVMNKPQAAIEVPPVCYEEELASLFPGAKIHPLPSGEELEAKEANAEHPLLGQITIECRELEAWWKSKGIAPDEVKRRSEAYAKLRNAQLSAIGEIGFRAVGIDPDVPKDPVEHPLADILPPDVADAVEATRLLIAGRTADARTLWQAILDRPAEQKKFRVAVAAWMLAKTSESDADALAAYARVRAEVAAGANDPLGLAAAAAGWLGPRQQDPVEGLHLLATAWKEGAGNHALIDLRRLSQRLLHEGTPEELAALAADPLARQILIVEVYTALDMQWGIYDDDSKEKFPFAPWLAMLEQSGPGQQDGAERIAWALYANGRYDAARRWLAMAEPSTPKAQWLKAKFALRDGKLDQADRALSRAVQKLRKSPEWQPANPLIDETPWLDSHSRRQANQGHLLTDAAVVDIAQGEYLKALDALFEADYWCDAAYLAESIVTTDELLAFTRKKAPDWSKGLSAWWQGKLPDQAAPKAVGVDGVAADPSADVLELGQREDSLRYLLGRRLAREFRFREARPFIPDPLLPAFDQLVALHRAAISGKYKGPDLAAILWHQAVITRNAGMEIYGTENAPDGLSRYYGMFWAEDFLSLRRFRKGWDCQWYGWDKDVEVPISPDPKLEPDQIAIPTVTRDEIRRATAHAVSPLKRFHYRYTAAEIGWQAAAKLPDNHNAKAYMLNTAGKWLAIRDPESADRFYQALVRRNPTNPLGQVADRKRWFISLDVPPDMPALPDSLRPSP